MPAPPHLVPPFHPLPWLSDHSPVKTNQTHNFKFLKEPKTISSTYSLHLLSKNASWLDVRTGLLHFPKIKNQAQPFLYPRYLQQQATHGYY